jgi:hypothetical protein
MSYSDIRPGDRVVILVHGGLGIDWSTGLYKREVKKATGRVVMTGPAGWVVDLGGRFGRPAICSPDTFVGFAPKRKGSYGRRRAS